VPPFALLSGFALLAHPAAKAVSTSATKRPAMLRVAREDGVMA
jgi:hypothetical protein